MVRGYADLRLNPTVLYVPAAWMKHLGATLLLPVFIFFLRTLLSGQNQSGAQTSSARGRKTLGARSFAGQRHAGRRGVVRCLPDLGRCRSYFRETASGQTGAGRTGIRRERHHLDCARHCNGRCNDLLAARHAVRGQTFCLKALESAL